MKKVTLFLFAASLLPSCVLGWYAPGEDFIGELKLEGAVTSTRNPWVWKVGQGNESLEIKQGGMFVTVGRECRSSNPPPRNS